jgi:hypothetical protein
MLFVAMVLGGLVIWLMLPAGYVHVKLCIGAGVFLLLGLWRMLRAPYWMRRPDEVERIDPGTANRVQIIMRGGRLFELAVSGAEREELELAIQQRANMIRLRAHVVVR